jgi:hypothetical protein
MCSLDSADDWSSPESRAAVGRLQRQMMALLAKYCAIDSRQHQLKLQAAAAAELAASNPAAAAAYNTESAELTDSIAQMEISIYEVLSNVTSLCTALVSKSGAYYQYLHESLSVCIALINCLVQLFKDE